MTKKIIGFFDVNRVQSQYHERLLEGGFIPVLGLDAITLVTAEDTTAREWNVRIGTKLPEPIVRILTNEDK